MLVAVGDVDGAAVGFELGKIEDIIDGFADGSEVGRGKVVDIFVGERDG